MDLQQSNPGTNEGLREALARRRNAGGDGPLVAMVIALVSIALLLTSFYELRDRAPDIDIAPVTTAPAAGVPAEAARPVEYFPDGYVNRATEPERQYETF